MFSGIARKSRAKGWFRLAQRKQRRAFTTFSKYDSRIPKFSTGMGMRGIAKSTLRKAALPNGTKLLKSLSGLRSKDGKKPLLDPSVDADALGNALDDYMEAYRIEDHASMRHAYNEIEEQIGGDAAAQVAALARKLVDAQRPDRVQDPPKMERPMPRMDQSTPPTLEETLLGTEGQDIAAQDIPKMDETPEPLTTPPPDDIEHMTTTWGTMGEAGETSIGGWASFGGESTSMPTLSDYQDLAAQTTLDDVAIPRRPAPSFQPRGQVTEALGTDPRRRYQFRYEIRELSDLVTSNLESGSVNPAYPTELQPRDRTRAASRKQINTMAATLQPDALLWDFASLDRGAPVIGPDDVVESGNARTLALRLAALEHPEQYAAYRDRLAQSAEGYGLDPEALSAFENPVLVRSRLGDVDRVRFAQEANEIGVMQMSDIERARMDAARIPTVGLMNFETRGQYIDYDLKLVGNRGFIQDFMLEIPHNERGALMDREGDLTQAGMSRLKAAMFTRVYGDERLATRIFEDPESDIKNVTNAMMWSLGRMAQVEEKIDQGLRPADLSITEDVVAAVHKFEDLQRKGTPISEYLQQQNFLGKDLSDDLTPTQKRILQALDERRRSGRKIANLINSWIDLVEKQPDPRQDQLEGAQVGSTREELIERWLGYEDQDDDDGQTSFFA
jgi:hypothetical protein